MQGEKGAMVFAANHGPFCVFFTKKWEGAVWTIRFSPVGIIV